VYGELPPVAVIDWEYALVAKPFGRDAVVIVRAAPTTIDSGWVADCGMGELLSEPLMMKL
jgi:hypothetical protein